jgi:dTDP-4-amino-4,6-dideoxygalactose transaminase
MANPGDVPFNRPLVLGGEEDHLAEVIRGRALCGNGAVTRRCCELLEQRVGCRRAILTPSCTAALEMCALLCDAGGGDEVIMPSYAFVSSASAFALRGAQIVWCDIRRDTKNIDEKLIAPLVTERTKAVVVVHYAGVGCEMDAICDLCRRRGLMLVEDAAQAIDCTYRGRPLGSFGDLATLSFHETKNVHCGEGGALLVNNPRLAERAEFVRDKGTNRSQFIRGLVDKYTWVELGSSFLASELQAAFLLPQLRRSKEVSARRLEHWRRYYDALSQLLPPEALPIVPEECSHNAHMFYILLENRAERERMVEHLRAAGIFAYFHYVPLHAAPYWKGRYAGVSLPVTDEMADRLLRLPMFYDLTAEQIDYVCRRVQALPGW